MKRFLIITILCTISFSLLAQSYKFQGSLTMSRSWTMADFGNNDIEIPESGFADHGFTLDIETAYNLNRRFSVSGMLLFGTNQVNSNAIGEKLEKRIKNHTPLNENDNLIFNVNYWLYGSLMFGPRYTITLSNMYIDLKALGGFNVTFMPEQEMIAEIRNQQNEIEQLFGSQSSKNSDFSLSGLIGADLRIPVREHISLKLSMNYFYSEIDMETEEFKVNQPLNNPLFSSLQKETEKIPIGLFNTGIGLVYYFD